MNLVLLALSMLVCANTAQAATKYVGPSGSAAWADCNSAGTPCSVATGLANAVAGDVVRFISGTYEPPNSPSDFEPSWHPTNDGTSGNPITLISDTLHGAVINDAANAAATGRAGFGTYLNDWIIIDGFSVVKDKATGALADTTLMVGTSSTNIHIQNIDGTGRAHSYHTNGAIVGVYEGSSNVYIHNNRLHDETADPSPVEAVVNASCLYIFEATNVYVYNNTIYNCNNGVSWKTNPVNINVYRNFLYTIGRAAFFPTIETSGANGHYIHHNVVLNCGRFIDSEDSPAGAGTYTDYHVYNNTVYHASSLGVIGGVNVSGGLVLGKDASSQTARSVRFYNNIISVGATSRIHEIHDDLVSDAMLGAPFDYNHYYVASGTQRFIYNATSTTTFATYQSAIGDDGEEANSLTSDPLFVNAGGGAVTDYRLAGGSPALASGYGGVDRGAFEGNPCIGDTCSPSPASFNPLINLRRAMEDLQRDFDAFKVSQERKWQGLCAAIRLTRTTWAASMRRELVC